MILSYSSASLTINLNLTYGIAEGLSLCDLVTFKWVEYASSRYSFPCWTLFTFFEIGKCYFDSQGEGSLQN